jgi:hypothetical protein
VSVPLAGDRCFDSIRPNERADVGASPLDITWLRGTHATLQTHLATSSYSNGMNPEP